MLALEENLDGIVHMLKVSRHEFSGLRAQAARLGAFIDNDFDLPKKDLAATPKQLQSRLTLAKLNRSLERFRKTLDTRTERFLTITRWQVVMLVTCVEAYLQDVLTTAASVDPKLMSKSEQYAPYADVISAASLDALANELRARWARGWLSDGGPTRWIARLEKMGARGYPKDLGPRLERFWGVRHVVVHAAGVATADFVKRHPGVVKAAGDRVRVNHHDYGKFVEAVREFLDPTEAFSLARYPSMLAVSTAPAK
ncbi:MAG: hypothetical protein Q7J73_02040 [Dehalococcoidales bacterium]|nr:hypothetical protein [Dehalococcoidales bacterium]